MGLIGEQSEHNLSYISKFKLENTLQQIDRPNFFSKIRGRLFSGHLDQSQVSGFTALLDYWENNFTGEDIHILAYILATVHHETGGKIQPVKEVKCGADHRYGDVIQETGHAYYGRGFVQLTWAHNYKRIGNAIGLGDSLYKNPDIALQLDVATKILYKGMIEGLFTGKRLSMYLTKTHTDWLNARRVINGVDRAEDIADYARTYYTGLLSAKNE